jgi:hypothetical protein
MQPALVGLKHHIWVELCYPMDDEIFPVISDLIFTLDQQKGEYVGHPVQQNSRLFFKSFKIGNFINRKPASIAFQYHLSV